VNSTHQVKFTAPLPHPYHITSTGISNLYLRKTFCIEVDIIEEDEGENDVAQETDMSKINSDAPVEQTGI